MAEGALSFIQIAVTMALPPPGTPAAAAGAPPIFLYGLTKEGGVYQWLPLRAGWQAIAMTEV